MPSIKVYCDEHAACLRFIVDGVVQGWGFTNVSRIECIMHPITGSSHQLIFVDSCVFGKFEYAMSIDGADPMAWIADQPITDYVVDDFGIKVIFDRIQFILYPWP